MNDAATQAEPTGATVPSTASPSPAAPAAQGSSALEAAAAAANQQTTGQPQQQAPRQQTVPFTAFDRERIKARDSERALRDAMAQNDVMMKKLEELSSKVNTIANPEPDPSVNPREHAAWQRQQTEAVARQVAQEESRKAAIERQREFAELQQSMAIQSIKQREAMFAAEPGKEDYFHVVDQFATLPIPQARRDWLMQQPDPVSAVYNYVKDFNAAQQQQRQTNIQQGAVETGGQQPPTNTGSIKLSAEQRVIAIKQGKALGLSEDKAVARYVKALSL